MLSKKHSDPVNWRNKLEALNALPEAFTSEKEVMWDKLHDRLQRKPAERKAVWHWLAAAFIPLVIITLTMVSKKKDVFVKQEKDKVTNTSRIFLQPYSKESVAVYNPLPVEKVGTVIPDKFKNNIPADKVSVKEIVVANTSLPVDIKPDQTISKMPAPDSNTTSVIVVSKKKLQVVHINELETLPPQFNEPVNYAQNLADKKTRKNKVNNLTIANQQNSIGFKIKLSSKN